MNVLEELRALDINEPGRWPLPFRFAAILLVLIGISALGIWYLVVRVEVPELERVTAEEQTLRRQFEDAQQMAANFDDYLDQLETIERDFGTMLGKLPGKTEVENLLEDISSTARGVGLDEKIFIPSGEVAKDFYAEYPVRLRYEGSYHEIGDFISEVAKLDRIVTLHDIRITPLATNGDVERLQLDAIGKTYRYLDEESP